MVELIQLCGAPHSWLAPLRRSPGASSGLLTPWRRRPSLARRRRPGHLLVLLLLSPLTGRSTRVEVERRVGELLEIVHTDLQDEIGRAPRTRPSTCRR